MVAYDVLIHGGKVVSSDGVFDADVCISEGKVARIERFPSAGAAEAARKINATGMVLLPGLLDSHVHFRDPGMTHKEDFETGTKGAAAGGVTTIFDMPTTLPVVTNAQLFREKLKIVSEKAVVDFGLYGAASVDNLGDIPELAREGAIAFKTYTVSPPKERVKEYAGSYITTTGQLLRVMEEERRTGLVHCIHAESDSTVACLTEKMHANGRHDPLAHCDSRPNFTEEEAVFDAILLSEVTGAKVHIVHASTSETSKLLANAKSRRLNVTSETCPHYLYFTKEALKKWGPYAKYNPPARSESDTEALIQGVNEGYIDTIVTDHAPHTKSEKEAGLRNIFKAPSGTPGVETRLPLLLTLAQRRIIDLSTLARVSSENVAKIFNLYPRKGSISIGSDADITIVDYKQEWSVDASKLQTKAWETVLIDGMRVRGRVRQTFVRGNTVYESGVGFGRVGDGSFIRGDTGRAA